MKPIKIKNHTKYSLEFIFKEADKLSDQILKSISENKNKSFVLFAFYSAIFSYSFVKVIERDYLFLILIFGTILSCIIIGKNLFPSSVTFNGSLPENMVNAYFEKFSSDELEKEYLATQIETYNTSINKNRIEIEKMTNRFEKSIYIILLSFFLFGVLFLLTFIECL